MLNNKTWVAEQNTDTMVRPHAAHFNNQTNVRRCRVMLPTHSIISVTRASNTLIVGEHYTAVLLVSPPSYQRQDLISVHSSLHDQHYDRGQHIVITNNRN